MAFTEETITQAFFIGADEKCEACGKDLNWEEQGRENDDWWEGHHKDGNPDNDSPNNCQILCWGCHKPTF